MKQLHSLFLCLILLWSLPAKADITLPSGFSLQTFAKVPNARSLVAVPERGMVFVSTRKNAIYAIMDKDQDGKAESVTHILKGLNVPNGIAWKADYLYVAEQHRLVRYKFGNWDNPEILYDKFPNKSWHGWRSMTFGLDGGLYVSIGAPCNICSLTGHEGTILRFEPKTWHPVIFAHGVRNSVGLAFDPISNDMFFSDNGADNMGDDLPPDELNRAPHGGLHFGYPYYGGGTARTYRFRDQTIPVNRPPLYEFQAHVAPLGLHFYESDRFPERYKNGIFVALHGSWNRSSPVGYQISFLSFNAQRQVIKEEPFLTGLKEKGMRPVDLATWADGRMLISDDASDKVYILDYQE